MLSGIDFSWLVPCFCFGILFQTSQSSNWDRPLIERTGGKQLACTFNPTLSTNIDIDPHMCTYYLYQFAILDESSYEMRPGNPAVDLQMNYYKKMTDLTKGTPCKMLISIGGWKDSTSKYSTLVADPSKRKNFVEKCIEFLEEYGFDGLDVAWEYPNACQGAINEKGEDKKNYVLLLQELKPKLAEKNMMLTVSVSAIKHEVEAAYDVPSITKLVDFINTMAYDLHGAWEQMTGHHSQFYPMPHDENSMDVISAIKLWISKGADKHKLIIGLCAYGRSFTLENPKNNGYGNKTIGPGKPGPETKLPGYLSYKEICHYIEDDEWTEKDDVRMGPYAYKGDQWVCYDSPRQVIRKTKHCIGEGLGGMMMKDISSDDYSGSCYDDKYPLLDMVRRELINCARNASAHSG